MTKTTYYTPSIEEFHVDFEYERNVSSSIEHEKWEKIDDFSNAYEYEDDPLYGVIKDLENENIRVKYLDKKDIESCGFTFYHRNDKSYWGGTCFTYIKGNDVGNLFLYCIPNKNKVVIRQELEQGENQLFDGHIKNINELKIILKQIQ